MKTVTVYLTNRIEPWTLHDVTNVTLETWGSWEFLTIKQGIITHKIRQDYVERYTMVDNDKISS